MELFPLGEFYHLSLGRNRAAARGICSGVAWSQPYVAERNAGADARAPKARLRPLKSAGQTLSFSERTILWPCRVHEVDLQGRGLVYGLAQVAADLLRGVQLAQSVTHSGSQLPFTERADTELL